MPQGSCFCGELKYSYEGEPIAKALCHCKDCQKLSASAYSSNVIAPGDNFKVIGTPRTYASKADSGNTMTNYFCNNCGVTIYRESPTFGPNKIVKAGTLDGDYDLSAAAPVVELFTTKRVNWLKGMDGVEQKEGMP